MSECVVRMEMPLDCQYCPMAHWDIRDRLMGCEAANGKRYLQGKDDEFWENGRPSWCPIICSFTGEEESPSPKPTDPVPIRDVYYVMTECDVKTGTVTYELRERSET